MLTTVSTTEQETTEQDRPTVRRTTTPVGDPAWLVTDYDLVRELLADRRLGRSHPDPESAPRYAESMFQGRPQPTSPTEQEDHARMRRLLVPWFSARRMGRLRPRVQQIVDELLDGLASRTPPTDFHEAVSFPLPALVICELLGVPFADRDDFRRWSSEAGDMFDRERSTAALVALWQYIHGLVVARLDDPGEDVLSALVAAHRAEPEAFGLDEVARLGAGLLFAGHETTVTAIDSGIVQLSTHPEQYAALRRDPGSVDGAVEEILRVGLRKPAARDRTDDPTAGADGRAAESALARWTSEEIEVAGTTIPAGDLVLLSLQRANDSAAVVGGSAALDLQRRPNPHITFGYAHHYCIGAPLARLELQVLFATLLRRFPGLRLAVPAGELRHRPELLIGGVAELPVTW